MEFISLQWTDESPPNDQCCYDHVSTETPIGTFRITWKSWKEYPSFDIEKDDTGWIDCGDDLEDAKQRVQKIFEDTVAKCLVSDSKAEAPELTDEQKICEFLYHGGYSVHKSGTWFGIYVGDKFPKNRDFLAYELNLLDALEKAHASQQES